MRHDNRINMERLNAIRNEIEFHVPVDLRNLIECKKEIFGLLTKLFAGCSAAIVIVSSLLEVRQSDIYNLNFWNNVINIVVNAGTLGNSAYEAGEFVRKVEGKRQIRKYLAMLRHLR